MVLCPEKGPAFRSPQVLLRRHQRGLEQLQGTSGSPQSGLGADLPQVVQCLLTDVDSLCLGTDFNDLLKKKNHDQQ